MSISPSTFIFVILISIFPSIVYSHNYINGSSNKNIESLQSILYSGNLVTELSPSELNKLFVNLPPIDHVVLFYINLNRDCRNFFPLFSQLYQDLLTLGFKIKLVKFNCQGVEKRLKMCQYYNINMVPTLAYISSYPIQRSKIPQKSYIRRFIYYLFSDKGSDLNLENATRYKGDIFNYDQLVDWVSLMYNISTINRRFGTKEDFVRYLKQLWYSFLSLFSWK